ncbi:MAG: pentapeptide repeat-containing protein [Anaerolineales bacterium]|nr:pentapeptide repeat-containing protein [Anaerolineales bacterium]
MNSRWKQYFLYASLTIIGAGLIYIIAETVKAKNTGFETKTLWDWMELLIIPLVLAIGAFLLNRSERAVERKLAESRAQLEREIATDRQQEVALQSYLDRMAELLLKDKLRTTKNKEVRDVVRIRTLTVLRGLDGRRKGDVLLFLNEAGLINATNPVIYLNGADLTGAHLQGINLNDTNLQSVNLSKAILQFANLERADLREALLHNAKLECASLKGAILSAYGWAGASLKNATMPDGTIHD